MYGLWLFKELKTEYGYCKIEVFKKSYSSTPIEIEAVEANSLTLSIENLSETISPIGKSVCSFSIVDTGQLSYDDFFTPDATGIKVVISTINEDRGDVAYTTRWSGFVTPDFYSESLVYRTAINISARDNIGYLSDVEFDLVEPSIQIRELFSKAFTKISEQYPMDVMFRSHKTTEDGVLLTDAVISTALFKDKTWGEVLELILHDLGLQMRWVDNNTIAVIDLSQIPEYYLPTQSQFINSSGYREILPAWRGLAQKQEFGIRENSFDGNILPQNLNFVEEIEIEAPYPSVLYGRQIKYSIPTNWQTTGDIFTANPNDYGEPFGKRIYFTSAFENYRYMSWRQPITASNSPMRITFKALNTLMIPADKLDSETGKYIGKYLREYIPATGKISSYWDGDVLQIGIKYNIILHAGLKSYIFKRDWIEIKEDTDLTPNQFILPEIKYTGENLREDPEQPKEEELNIGIVTIPYTGELEFVLYGWEEIERRTYWEETFGEKYSWDKFFAYIADVTYTFDGENKATGQEAKTSINPLHNILRNENYQLGNVPKYGGGIGAYAGGLFNLVGEELSTFKRNEDSQSYNLLELVGREIIHFNKKNYNKLSGEIKSPTKEPLKFNSLFSREGKLYYPFSCSLNVIDNTMTITSMQEVEPYTTESFTEIHNEVKSDGGTTVSGGNNTVLQYSEEAGNAKRLYEMQDATLAEKEKAFALVDSPDFPQARRIRVADLIGLDEQALAQYLELNKYVQEDDLTPITNRIEAVEGYFTNGSAKDALKLGGIVAENYWHKGNSGTLDYDWRAKKLNVRTLVIPTSEPTDLSQGEVGFYLGTAGQGAELPNGSGGLDLTELWAELGSEDYAKKIHISHIPTIQYSSIAGRPSALVNPYALTINGVVYDGSEPISLDISAGGGVADAVAWGNVFNKPTTISGYGITDAYTKDGVDLKLSNYLPKSGGTINGNLTLNATSNAFLQILLNGTSKALVGWQSNHGVRLYNYASASYLSIKDDGTPTYNDNTLIHSDNIGSYAMRYYGTNMPADIVNHVGYGRAETGWKMYGPAISFGISSYYTQIQRNYNSNEIYVRGYWEGNYTDWKTIAFTDSNVASADYASNAGNATTIRGWDINIYNNKPFGGIPIVANNGVMAIGKYLDFYYTDDMSKYAARIQCQDIRYVDITLPSRTGTLALLTDNVASATKLATARTIWGQSFDGSANVDGSLYISNKVRLHSNDGSELYVNYGGGANNGNLYLCGYNVQMFYGTSSNYNVGFLLNNSGNIIVGGIIDNGYKLQVNGTFKANGLIIPTSAPTDLKAGDHALYLGSVGEGAELPSGVGGLDVAELWAELAKADESKQINISHIPTIEIARVSGLQTILNNKADASALSSYLLKSGGTISSNSVVPLTVNSTGDNTRIAFKQNGDTLGYFAFAKANTPLFIDNEGGRYTMFHSGNFNPADYLPKTGGTISSSHFQPLIVNSTYSSTVDDVRIALSHNDKVVGLVNWESGIGMRLYNAATGAAIGVKDDGTPFYNSHTLIHTGNIGSQSVNYATTAGSAKASDVYAWAKAATKPSYTASEVGALSTSGGTISGLLTLQHSIVVSSGADRKLVLNNTDTESKYQFISFKQEELEYGKLGTAGTDDLRWNNDIVLHSGNYSSYALPLSGGTLIGGLTISAGNFIVQSGDTVLSLCYPTADNAYALGHNGRRWSDVRTVLINGGTPIHSSNIGSYNAGSATKLQTARTIWGQSFDGTGNVRGAITDATSLKYNANYTYGIYVKGSVFTSAATDDDVVISSLNKTIFYGGNVLIGTTTDNGSKLQVNGAMEATELVIPTAPPTNPQAGKHYLYLA